MKLLRTDGKPATGFEVWRDASRVAIVTFASRNAKTGSMCQLWILVRDMGIGAARQTGADELTCGDCPLRGNHGCYVAPMGPSSVWRTWQVGGYPVLSLDQAAEILRGERIRLGAYGDPAMLPLEVLEAVTRYADRWTGYTHAWQHCRPEYARYLMASCDTPAHTSIALTKGYRTFTLAPQWTPGVGILCPASEEAGHRTHCADCCLCDGRRTESDRRANIYIPIHGFQKSAAAKATARV